MPAASLAAGAIAAKAAAPALKAGPLAGRIQLDSTDSPDIKDPSFVNFGEPVAGTRYVAFGDLRSFYMKAFDVLPGGALAFRKGELKLAIRGLPKEDDGLWAPQLRVAGDRLELYYCAGRMPPNADISWPSFRLHRAVLPLAAFQQGSTTFTEQGVILDDIAPFGANDQDFAVIDPGLYVNAAGHAYMSYVVVRTGVPNVRGWDEAVHVRRVDPADPAHALGPNQLVYDGKPGSSDDGVAEAPDYFDLDGRTYAFISSRPGDIDQRVLVAAVGPELEPIERSTARAFLFPGPDAWKAKAVGSTGAAAINGTGYMVYQGLDAKGRFTLGWTTLAR